MALSRCTRGVVCSVLARISGTSLELIRLVVSICQQHVAGMIGDSLPWRTACFHGKAPELNFGSKRYPVILCSTESAGQKRPSLPQAAWMDEVKLLNLAALDGETVLDPFCGSGTTLVAAKGYGPVSGRHWLMSVTARSPPNRLRQSVLNFEPGKGVMCI